MGKKLFRRSAALVVMLMVLSTGIVANAEGTYTVEKGDYLKKIAQSVYGDAARWEDIYEANKASVKNPNIIYKGQVLILPDINSAPEENPETEIPENEETETIETALTLEQWTMSEECRAIEQMSNGIVGEMGLAVALKADGNTLVFEYTFSPEAWNSLTEEEMKAVFADNDFDTVVESQRGLVEELKQEFDMSYGIKLEGVRYVYIAPDGSTPVYSAELK